MPNVGVSEIAELMRASAPRLGATRLVLVDGPAGSGKTTLAGRIGHALDGPVQVLHADDMYEGWSGLDTLGDVLIDQVLEPLASGRPGQFAAWDWARSRRGRAVEVLVRPLLVIEGVGVAMRRARAYAGVVVWIEAPAQVCLQRGIARDGEAMRAEWVAWQQREARMFARERTRENADVVVDGTQPVSA